MSLYLFGIIEAKQGVEFGDIGFADRYGNRAALTTVPYGGVAMAVCEVEGWEIRQDDKADLLDKLIVHQKILEQVMKQQFILPVKFGTIVEDGHDVVNILSRHRARFEEAIREMSPYIEVDIVAVWDVQTMLKKIANEDDEISEMKQAVESLSPEKREGRDLMAIGMRLEEKLEERRVGIEKVIFGELDPMSSDHADHERLEDRMVINSSFLIEKAREKDFFHAMDALDEKLDRSLKFKCLSPLPPHSFKTVVIEKVDPADLKESIKLFSVTPGTTLEKIKVKNRTLTKKHHPDKAGGDGSIFEKVNSSYKLLCSLFEGDKGSFGDLDTRNCYCMEIRREETPGV